MEAINTPDGLIPEKEFKRVLSKVERWKESMGQMHLEYSDDPRDDYWYDADLCYQYLVEPYGNFVIEQSLPYSHEGKWKNRLLELIQKCKEYESLVRKDMYDNISEVYGEKVARELSFDVPISMNAVWRAIEKKKTPRYYRDLATIICHYIEYKGCLGEEFWEEFFEELMIVLGVKKALAISESIMEECVVWKKYFNNTFTWELPQIEKPDVKSLSALEQDFYAFLKTCGYWYLFGILRGYISYNQDEIFKSIAQERGHYLKATLLLAFSTWCIEKRYDLLLKYHNRLNEITKDDKYSRMLISKANAFCKLCGYAPIPLNRQHENAKDNSEYEVPWEDVTFEKYAYRIDNISIDGKAPISYRYTDVFVRSDYNWLRYFFRMKVKPIVLMIENGEVVGGRFPRFNDYVTKPHFSDISTVQFEFQESELPKYQHVERGKINRITYEDFRRLVPEGKDSYVDKLCHVMMDTDNVLEFTENNSHSHSSHLERGFAFLLADSNIVKTYAFENHEDSRCTLIFKAKDSTYVDDLQLVADFLISDKKNKRQAMQRGAEVTVGNRVLYYDRVNHDEDWEVNIQRIINSR